MDFVIDASLLIEALEHPGPPRQRIIGKPLAAPHLIDVEVANSFRRRVAAGELDADVARGLIAIDARYEINRFPHAFLLERAWDLRHNLTVYDAMYVALAEALDLPLVTCDDKTAGVPGCRCEVVVVPPADR